MFEGLNMLERWNKYSNAMRTMQTMKQPEVGSTAKETVYSEGKVQLYRYKATTKTTLKTPVLIVYALVNRPYIIDLDEKRSMVGKLLDKGVDVYLIDWGYPDRADRYQDLGDYVHGYINNCVNAIRQQSECDAINLLGICQGGTFSCCYSSLYPEKVKNLITMVAPFDFHTKGNTLSNMTRDVDMDQLYQANGNIRGALLNRNFNSLNPVSLNLLKSINIVDSLQDEESAAFFLRMEHWIQDGPDQAGAALSEFVTKLYQKNQLVKGELDIGGERVDTQRITQPVLNVYAKLDHIVPPEASQALKQLCASEDYSELAPKTGHIGMYVSAQAKEIPTQMYDWLQQREA